MKYSSSKEDYLKAIYHLQSQDGVVSTNELAGELQTRAASVTDMLKKLKDQKLLNYEPYKGFRLSSEGRRVAVQVVRKHRLWEYFLVEKLGFGWDEVHEIAEELEHVTSRKLIERLDEFLGFPKTDPHGDPIPDSSGKLERAQQISLSELAVNLYAQVSGIGDQSSEMLELLKHKKPVVLMDRYLPGVAAPHVLVDNFGGVVKGMKLLFKKGFRNIAFVTVDLPLIQMEERERAYLQVLKSNGISQNKSMVLRLKYNYEKDTAVNLITDFIKKNPRMEAMSVTMKKSRKAVAGSL